MNHKETESSQNVWLCFQGFRMPFLPQYHYWLDGRPGSRCLFISNVEQTFVMSFEEGMRCIDLVEGHGDEKDFLQFETRRGEVYLHERRTKAKSNGSNYSFFHFEISDAEGRVRYLPGQINVRPEYYWSNGPDPVLLDLLEGIALASPATEKE